MHISLTKQQSTNYARNNVDSLAVFKACSGQNIFKRQKMLEIKWSRLGVLLSFKLAAIIVVCISKISVSALPNGFVDEGVASITAITGAFAPNPTQNGKPMLLVSSKEGLIYAFPDPDNSDARVLVGNFTRLTCSNGERGLQTILPHPNFMVNSYIYVFYTRYIINCPEDTVLGPSNRLSRFTMNPSTLRIDTSSEVVMLETPPAPKFNHIGGSMRIGNDGYLYITTGDGGALVPRSQYLNNLFGKVIRLNLNGNVPQSNPFTRANNRTGVPCRFTRGRPPTSAPSNAICEEIFSYGLRNPFRMAMDPNTNNKVRFVIGDVGGLAWEEINEGGSDHIGTNYMWPIYEGPFESRAPAQCNRRNASGPGITEPFYYYDHTIPNTTSGVRGAAITGSVFVPNGLWPDKYKYMFIDFIFNRIYNLIPDESVACQTCRPPVPAFRNETFFTFDRMVDMFFGPYQDAQALYIVSRSSGQNIRRIRYTGRTNSAPIAVIRVNGTQTVRNRTLAFNGRNSIDPDGDVLSYFWDFADGETSTLVNPFKRYTQYGEYHVTLTVTDSFSQRAQSYVNVVIGTRPTAFIELPLPETRFVVGQRLHLRGNATDSGGRVIPSSQIFWEVRQHHADHFHPFLDQVSGNGFDIHPAPAPEDIPSATNSYLRILMTAVDRNGLTRTVDRVVQPRTIRVYIESIPSGLIVSVNDRPYITPQTIIAWENQILSLRVTSQGRYEFDHWSMGGEWRTTFTVRRPTTTRQRLVAIMKNASVSH